MDTDHSYTVDGRKSRYFIGQAMRYRNSTPTCNVYFSEFTLVVASHPNESPPVAVECVLVAPPVAIRILSVVRL